MKGPSRAAGPNTAGFQWLKLVVIAWHIKELQAYDDAMEKIAVKEAQVEAERLLGRVLKERKHYPKVQAFLN